MRELIEQVHEKLRLGVSHWDIMGDGDILPFSGRNGLQVVLLNLQQKLQRAQLSQPLF
jgi:hypothetical protein